MNKQIFGAADSIAWSADRAVEQTLMGQSKAIADEPYLRGFGKNAAGLPLTPEEQAAHDSHYASGTALRPADIPVVGNAFPSSMEYDTGLVIAAASRPPPASSRE